MAATAVTGARDLLWRGVEATGLNALARRGTSARLLIVCYHGVCADDSPVRHWLLVRRATFARQLDYLQSRFRIVSLDEGVAELSAGHLREPSACITFDDGYRNNFTIAWPELRSRGLPATIFLATGLISTDSSLWTTALEFAVRGSTQPALDLREWSGPCLPTDSAVARAAAGHGAKEFLKNLPAATRREILERLMARLRPVPVPAEFSFLTWDEVHGLAQTGLIRFGAHTVNHEILSRLDAPALDYEVRESVACVARLGDAASAVFAYPNGRPEDFDQRAFDVLRAARIAAAVTTIPGTNSRDSRPLMLRRLVVDESMTLGRFGAEAGGLIAMLRDSDAVRGATARTIR